MSENPPAGVVELLRKLGANSRWAIAHDAELQAHVWKYVAIDDERILGVGDSHDDLQRKFADREALLVTFVSPPDMAWMF
jgi:hypothetical protein